MIVSEVEVLDVKLTSSNSQNAVYTQTYRVKLDGYTYIDNFLLKQYATFLILGDPQIPQDYDKLDLSEMTSGAYLKSTFRCTDRSIVMTHSGDSGSDSLFSVWAVTVIYTANVGIVTGAITTSSRLMSITRGFQPYDFVSSKSYKLIDWFGDDENDKQGDPTKVIENSAFDPPSEGLTTVRNISWIEMELEYLDENFDKEWLTTSFMTVNRLPETVCDYVIGEFGGKLTLKDAKQIVSGSGQIYWIVKVLLEMKDEGWITEWLDSGFNVIEDEKSTPILQKDINENITGDAGDQKVSDPQKLDGFGGLLPEGADPVFNQSLITYSESWAHLDLPTSLKAE